MSLVGKVFSETLIIAYGDGRNGKSTFWNVLARVLGSYSGKISADALTVGCRRNVKPEMAEAKGKRLLIASELEEGMRLNTSIVKQLCSTDPIEAEKKYKDPFHFEPSHHPDSVHQPPAARRSYRRWHLAPTDCDSLQCQDHRQK